MDSRNKAITSHSLFKRLRGRWLYIAASIALFLIVIILLIPTLASLSPARSYVLSKINAKLHGKLQVKSWSLGWRSGFHAAGISLRGKKGEVVSIQQLSTGLTLPQLIRGDYALGNVLIDGLHFDITINDKGDSNLQQIFAAAAPQPKKHPAVPSNSALPNISGNITLRNITGSISRLGSPPIAVSVHGTLKIPSIDRPIENDLSATLQSAPAAPGEITFKGDIAAIQNHQILPVSKMAVHEQMSLKGIDLAGFAPLLPTKEIDTLTGVANGQLEVIQQNGVEGADKGTATGKLVARGTIDIQHVHVSGPALRGDTYSTHSLTLNIPGITVASNHEVATTKPIQIQFDQGSASFGARASLPALQNLANSLAPGSDGFVSADIHLDCAALARQLPRMLDLQRGVALKSAQMTFSAMSKLAVDRATITQHLELSHLSGTDDARPIVFAPINLDARATILPSQTPIPNLHDLSLQFASDFASADFHGASVAEFSGSAHADLAAAQRELAQLFDFHNWELQGGLAVALTSRGDLSNPSAPIQIRSSMQAKNLAISGGVQAIREPFIAAVCNGKILRDSGDSITGIDDLSFLLKTGAAVQPIIAMTADGSIRLHPDRRGWRMIEGLHLHMKLPDVPRAASLAEALKRHGVRWTSGKATIAIDLAGAGGGLTGGTEIAATNLAFQRGENAYRFEPIRVNVAGKLSGNGIQIRKLAGSLGSLASINLIQPVLLSTSPRPTAQGQIRIAADLAKATALANAWEGASLSKQTISGQMVLAQTFSTDADKIAARGTGTITNLQVATDSQPQFQENSVKIINDLLFDSRAQSLLFKKCSISMATTHALDADLSGAVTHLWTTRDFHNVRVTLSYDLAAMLKIITPLLPETDRQTLDEYSITGVQKHTIAFTGSFPTGQSATKSLRRIQVTGSLGLDSLQGNGIAITDLSPEFMLRDGLLTITGNGAIPAKLNGGKVTLTGISCDLRDPALRISTPADLQLVQGTNLNASMLGKFGSNLSPVLSNPTKAAGVLSISLAQCTNFSLTQFIHQPSPGTSTGTIKATFSVADVQIANDMAALIGAFSPQTVFNHRLVGNIDKAEVSINNGLIWSSMKLRIGKNLILGFHGYIDLQTKRLQHFILDFPTPLIGDFTSLVHLNGVPTDIPIPITGTTSHYTLDLSGVNQLVNVATKDLGKGADKVGKAIGGGVNHASKFLNGLFHHKDNDEQ